MIDTRTPIGHKVTPLHTYEPLNGLVATLIQIHPERYLTYLSPCEDCDNCFNGDLDDCEDQVEQQDFYNATALVRFDNIATSRPDMGRYANDDGSYSRNYHLSALGAVPHD